MEQTPTPAIQVGKQAVNNQMESRTRCLVHIRSCITDAVLLFSRSVLSDSLQPHGLLYARLPCPLYHLLKFAQVHVYYIGDNHPTISSPDAPFSFCLHSFPAAETFSVSRLFPARDQSSRASVSAPVLPMSIQG